MHDDHYISLVHKQLSGDISQGERGQLEAWLQASPDHRHLADTVQKTWELSDGFSETVNLDLDKDFRAIEQKIGEDGTVVRPLFPRSWLLRVAAVFALVVGGYFVWNALQNPAETFHTASTTDQPSTDAIQLADGSKVWLNENSNLEYFTSTTGDERWVKLAGEAFFEVAKDPTKPFIVETSTGEVRVLGTSFSVLNRTGDIDVYVTAGRVLLSPKGISRSIIMTSNERGRYQKNTFELVKEASPSLNEIAWHTKKLNFENVPLLEVMEVLSKHHDVSLELENQDKALLDCPVNVTFDNKSIEVAVETLATILRAEHRKDGERGYVLVGGSCE